MPRLRPLICHMIPWEMFTGGAQRFVVDLSNWAKSWADVHIIYQHQDGDSLWAPLVDGCTMHPAASSARAEQIARELRPDLIHHHSPDSRWGIVHLLGSLPIVGTPHGWAGNQSPPEWATPIAGPHTHLIRHGVDLDAYQPRQRRRAKGPFRVGVVGRIRHDKLPESFLAALAAMPRPEWELHFYGRGLFDSQTQRIEQAIADIGWPVLHGDVAPDQMQSVYHDIDLLLVPSAKDSVSLVAVEAMASGLPVVVRETEGLPDTVGDAGVICATDQDLLAAVDRLSRDQVARKRLGRYARQRAQELYDIARMFRQYNERYCQASGGLVRQPDPELDVSVVMPVADGVEGAWFREAAESVLSQPVRAELIVIDDGVTDAGLAEAINAYSDRATVLRNDERRGIPNSLNQGIKIARADLIARADGDDVMTPNRLAEQLAIMRELPDLALLSGDMFYILHGQPPAKGPVRHFRPGVPLWSYWKGLWPIAHPTVMMRRYVPLALGGYDESVLAAQDLDLWCRIQRAGYRIEKRDVYWNIYRCHAGQVTAQREMVAAETDKVLARYNGGPATAPAAITPDTATPASTSPAAATAAKPTFAATHEVTGEGAHKGELVRLACMTPNFRPGPRAVFFADGRQASIDNRRLRRINTGTDQAAQPGVPHIGRR